MLKDHSISWADEERASNGCKILRCRQIGLSIRLSKFISPHYVIDKKVGENVAKLLFRTSNPIPIWTLLSKYFFIGLKSKFHQEAWKSVDWFFRLWTAKCVALNRCMLQGSSNPEAEAATSRFRSVDPSTEYIELLIPGRRCVAQGHTKHSWHWGWQQRQRRKRAPSQMSLISIGFAK